MVFTSKATLPQGERIGSYEAKIREKQAGYKQEFETHYKAAAR